MTKNYKKNEKIIIKNLKNLKKLIFQQTHNQQGS